MKFVLSVLAALFLCAGVSSRALIVAGEEAQHRARPLDGIPWDEVAQIGNGKGTGVYLGEGLVLTAGHVAPNTPVVLKGVRYDVDKSFGKEGARQIASTDLKVLRILSALPPGGATLTGAAEDDLLQPCAIVAWGVGKGRPVAEGWEWGGDDTARQRWGRNVTNPTVKRLPEGAAAPQFVLLTTSFDRAAGADEAQLAGQDSGAALFIKIAGVWKLAGSGSDVTTVGKALFDNDPAKAGLQPDQSLFVRIKTHREEILSVVNSARP